jgi:hypothetical protein
MENDAMNFQSPESADRRWQATFFSKLPLFGHRNWIVIADSAYPAQSGAGITTITADSGHLDVLREVLGELAAAGHVRPRIYADRELNYVDEMDARGISAYREQLHQAVRGADIQFTPHEEIIARLDSIADKFEVLIIKSRLTIPYTSIFLELDCGYWNANAEARLRAAMK